nr:Nramp family divalent metal transporter [uncultured Sphaerochaeta sp.]
MEAKVQVRKKGWFKRLFAFIGPAYLVSVGYMDPGNWATDIEGGARFGYALIWVLLMSNLMAVLLQTLSARLGIVTGYDLAQGCKREYPKNVNYGLWISAEIAIAATDLAEVLGTIIGLNLLFGLPLLWGCAVTLLDTFLLLAIHRLGVRKMEAFIVMLIATIGFSFLIELFLSEPSTAGILSGFIPTLPSGSLYIAIGIIGATVMPHNLYLHSSLVQSRAISSTFTGKNEACKYNLIDSAVALNAAFFVNAAILIVSAATFFSRGMVVTEIEQAHHLLEPILGSSIAPIAFALALIAAGQSSTLTGTITGQIIMEGFLNIKLRPWLRRLITRSIAILPAVIVIAISGKGGTYQLLIFSQVLLSLQLPFAVIPLIHFTSDKKKMGLFANKLWVKILSWFVAAIIVTLNMKLALDEIFSLYDTQSWYISIGVSLLLTSLLILLGYITFAPFFGHEKEWESGAVSISKKIAQQIKPLKIGHIGVALEYTDSDKEIISSAVSMARLHKANITLIHISESPTVFVHGQDSSSLHIREDSAYLLELAREIEDRDLPVETYHCAGNPSKEIINFVNDSDLDLLIMGSHGHQTLQAIVFGKTADAVRAAVNIPILTVRVGTYTVEKAQKGV